MTRGGMFDARKISVDQATVPPHLVCQGSSPSRFQMILSHESRILRAFECHPALKTQQRQCLLQFFALQREQGFSMIE
jgi:hypothetical protein